MENTIEGIEATTSYTDWYTQQWIQKRQNANQKSPINWFGMIPSLIFIGVTAFFITKIIKTAKSNHRKKHEAIEAEKQAQRADEERRHQEILQAIRESGKIPDDYK